LFPFIISAIAGYGKNNKSSTGQQLVYSKIKDPVKPLPMRAVKVVINILLGAFMLVAIAG
jgi:hypothetical protein